MVAELAALKGDWVSVAVIGPEALLPVLGDVLPQSEGVSLLDPLGAKGLEFDAVIVVEPAAIYRGGQRRPAPLRRDDPSSAGAVARALRASPGRVSRRGDTAAP